MPTHSEIGFISFFGKLPQIHPPEVECRPLPFQEAIVELSEKEKYISMIMSVSNIPFDVEFAQEFMSYIYDVMGEKNLKFLFKLMTMTFNDDI